MSPGDGPLLSLTKLRTQSALTHVSAPFEFITAGEDGVEANQILCGVKDLLHEKSCESGALVKRGHHLQQLPLSQSTLPWQGFALVIHDTDDFI
jgi:hypothetical protein